MAQHRVDRRRGGEILAQMTLFGLNGLAAGWWDNPDIPRDQVVGTAIDLLWTGISGLGRGGSFEARPPA